jgi:hypothetical protein
MTLEIRVMVFNATFNNILVIWWQSVLLVPGGNRNTQRKPQTCKQSPLTITHCTQKRETMTDDLGNQTLNKLEDNGIVFEVLLP